MVSWSVMVLWSVTVTITVTVTDYGNLCLGYNHGTFNSDICGHGSAGLGLAHEVLCLVNAACT